MRVLICATEYHPDGSGIANVLYNVVRELEKKSHMKINAILVYHVVISSIKKGQFRNVLLIADKISISDIEMFFRRIPNGGL